MADDSPRTRKIPVLQRLDLWANCGSGGEPTLNPHVVAAWKSKGWIVDAPLYLPAQVAGWIGMICIAIGGFNALAWKNTSGLDSLGAAAQLIPPEKTDALQPKRPSDQPPVASANPAQLMPNWNSVGIPVRSFEVP